MTVSAIDGLLREHQATIVAERRSIGRQAIVRPVEVKGKRGENHRGFSRDVSENGISLILPAAETPGTIAELSIHRLFGPPSRVRAELRWSDHLETTGSSPAGTSSTELMLRSQLGTANVTGREYG